MLKKLNALLVVLLIGCTPLFFGACDLCFDNNRVTLLEEGFVKTYDQQESAVFVLRATDSIAQIDTLELLVKKRELIFVDRRSFDDCNTYDEAYYVQLESENGIYSLQNYLFAEDTLRTPRQVAFSLMKQDTVLLSLSAAEYSIDNVENPTPLIGAFENTVASYKADSGILSASSKEYTLKRIQ